MSGTAESGQESSMSDKHWIIAISTNQQLQIISAANEQQGLVGNERFFV